MRLHRRFCVCGELSRTRDGYVMTNAGGKSVWGYYSSARKHGESFYRLVSLARVHH